MFACQAFTPYVVGGAIDDGLKSGFGPDLWRACGTLLALGAVIITASVLGHRYDVENWLRAAFTSSQLVGGTVAPHRRRDHRGAADGRGRLGGRQRRAARRRGVRHGRPLRRQPRRLRRRRRAHAARVRAARARRRARACRPSPAILGLLVKPLSAPAGRPARGLRPADDARRGHRLGPADPARHRRRGGLHRPLPRAVAGRAAPRASRSRGRSRCSTRCRCCCPALFVVGARLARRAHGARRRRSRPASSCPFYGFAAFLSLAACRTRRRCCRPRRARIVGAAQGAQGARGRARHGRRRPATAAAPPAAARRRWSTRSAGCVARPGRVVALVSADPDESARDRDAARPVRRRARRRTRPVRLGGVLLSDLRQGRRPRAHRRRRGHAAPVLRARCADELDVRGDRRARTTCCAALATADAHGRARLGARRAGRRAAREGPVAVRRPAPARRARPGAAHRPGGPRARRADQRGRRAHRGADRRAAGRRPRAAAPRSWSPRARWCSTTSTRSRSCRTASSRARGTHRELLARRGDRERRPRLPRRRRTPHGRASRSRTAASRRRPTTSGCTRSCMADRPPARTRERRRTSMKLPIADSATRPRLHRAACSAGTARPLDRSSRSCTRSPRPPGWPVRGCSAGSSTPSTAGHHGRVRRHARRASARASPCSPRRCSSGTRSASSMVFGETVFAELREEFVETVTRLPLSTVERAGTGDLVGAHHQRRQPLQHAVRFGVPRVIVAVVDDRAHGRRGLVLVARVVAVAMFVGRAAAARRHALVPAARDARRTSASPPRTRRSTARSPSRSRAPARSTRSASARAAAARVDDRPARGVRGREGARCACARCCSRASTSRSCCRSSAVLALGRRTWPRRGRSRSARSRRSSLYAYQLTGPVWELIFWLDEIQVARHVARADRRRRARSSPTARPRDGTPGRRARRAPGTCGTRTARGTTCCTAIDLDLRAGRAAGRRRAVRCGQVDARAACSPASTRPRAAR